MQKKLYEVDGRVKKPDSISGRRGNKTGTRERGSELGRLGWLGRDETE